MTDVQVKPFDPTPNWTPANMPDMELLDDEVVTQKLFAKKIEYVGRAAAAGVNLRHPKETLGDVDLAARELVVDAVIKWGLLNELFEGDDHRIIGWQAAFRLWSSPELSGYREVQPEAFAGLITNACHVIASYCNGNFEASTP